MARNQYPGPCYRCGLPVEEGTGYFERHQGKWRTQHAYTTQRGGVTCEMARRKAQLPTKEEKMTPQEILTKLQGLDGPDREVDIDLWHETLGPEERHLLATFDGHVYTPFGFTSSVDAALAFGEALLPGWFIYGIENEPSRIIFAGDNHETLGAWLVEIQVKQGGGRLTAGQAPTLPIAILIAYLSAWIEQQK